MMGMLNLKILKMFVSWQLIWFETQFFLCFNDMVSYMYTFFLRFNSFLRVIFAHDCGLLRKLVKGFLLSGRAHFVLVKELYKSK